MTFDDNRDLLKGTWLPETNPSVLGFNAFADVGGRPQIIAPGVIRGVQGATARASAIAGPGVTGWLVSAELLIEMSSRERMNALEAGQP